MLSLLPLMAANSSAIDGSKLWGAVCQKKDRKGPMIFIIYPGYLVYILDIYYISRIYNKYLGYLTKYP